ncbi:pentalenene synthase [Kitasatospora misakiensis]|uniref:Terpene synthase n=1 Tax=Kitasatospora misakiensis TaxID=67330 RepID=A0ABW0X3J6_9ACTN
MPQDVDFGLPWPLRVNPHLDEARARNLEWMRGFGLLDEGHQAAEGYLGWQLAEVSAYFYPEATAEGLCLAADLMGWYFTPFDDRFDGPLGRDPAAVGRTVAAYTRLLHRPVVDPGAPAAERAFVDVWRRWPHGMSPAWQARTVGNWTDYLAVHHTEALVRCGLLPVGGETEHLWRRRRSTSSFVVNDLGERTAGFEVPPLLWYGQTLSRMREVAAEVVAIANDTASLEKEERDGDSHNLILLLESRGRSRQEALAGAVERVAARVEEFEELERDLARAAPHLSPADRESAARYVTLLQDCMTGNCAWQRTSTRYAAPTGPAA